MTTAAPPYPGAPGTAGPSDTTPPAEAGTEQPRRRSIKAFIVLGIFVLVVLAGIGLYLLVTRDKESTDDAQLEADVVALAPEVEGRVVRVLVHENQPVKTGQLVLEIASEDYAAQVAKTRGELAQARAAVSSAQVQARNAEVQLRRMHRLHTEGAVPEERIESAQTAAHAAVDLAQGRVEAAKATLDAADLRLSYTKVVAPADGYVSRLTAHVGQIVTAAQPVAELVPDAVYVLANFKETQIGHMRPGQRASVLVDAYPFPRTSRTSRGAPARASLSCRRKTRRATSSRSSSVSRCASPSTSAPTSRFGPGSRPTSPSTSTSDSINTGGARSHG